MRRVFAGVSGGLIGSSRLHLGVCRWLHGTPKVAVCRRKLMQLPARGVCATGCAPGVSGAVREQRPPTREQVSSWFASGGRCAASEEVA